MAAQETRVVGVRGAVDGEKEEGTRVQAEFEKDCLGRTATAAGCEEGIDHDIAGVFRPSGEPLDGEVLDGGFVGRKKEVGGVVDENPVDLLGHGPVEAAQAGLDVDDGDAELRSGEGAGEGAVGIAEDDDGAGGVREQVGLDAFEGTGGHCRVGTGADAEVAMGLGDAEFAEEPFRHAFVVVLAGVQDALVMSAGAGFGRERRQFDELGPGADDGGESHGMSEPEGKARRTPN